MGHGRFCEPGSDADRDFNDYWWEETCKFETYVTRQFGSGLLPVSSDTPFYKEFCIWPQKGAPLDKACEACLDYLDANHPTACVELAGPLAYRIGTGRLVLTLNGIWLDQDLIFWFSEKSNLAGFALPGFNELRGNNERIDIESALPWLKSQKGKRVKSQEFWRMVYSNHGLSLVGKTGAEESERYSLGGEIVSHLSQRYWVLDENESCEVYISGSLGSHRVVKVECSRQVCDQNFVESVFRVVARIDGTWAVRFAVYEDLIADNAYLGGIIMTPQGEFMLEGHSWI